jgi:hypothetical protein
LDTFNKMTFIQFLFEVGMFENDKIFENISDEDKSAAYQRYINALSASVRGTGTVFLKRGTKDIFTNNFNRRILEVHKANHDIQIVVDQVCFYSVHDTTFLIIIHFSMHAPNTSLDI